MKEHDLYLEVIKFISSSSGYYEVLTERVCQEVVQSIFNGQYLIDRDAEGNINQFVSYWKIRDEDVAKAFTYVPPPDIFSGDIIFVVIYANRGGIRGLAELFTRMMPKHEPDAKAICYEHKGRFVRLNRADSGHLWVLQRG